MDKEKIAMLYEGREQLVSDALDPMNKLSGLSEATGLKILDGIYVLIAMLRESGSSGTITVNIAHDKVTADEISHQIKTILKKQLSKEAT